jgi:HEPN domain-containing protein
MTKDEIVNYWIDSSSQDYEVMETLFANGHNVWSLFVGHLVIEKLLKAYHVKNVLADYPHIHDLLKIAENATLVLTNNERSFLDEVTAFNIRARYPDYKNRFYKTANREFTEQYIKKIREFRQWLLHQIKG